MLSPAQLAFLVGLPLCDCFGGALFAVILHPFGFAAHPEPGTTPSNVRETRATGSPQQQRMWIHTVGRHISGYNTKRLTGVTIEECKEECANAKAWYGSLLFPFGCLSFDWFVTQGSTCDLSVQGPSTVDLTAPGENGGAYDNYAIDREAQVAQLCYLPVFC